jgi:hypothetical protein
MASDSRTLKLAILGEVKGLTDSLDKSSKDVEGFGDKITKFGALAGAAFLAAGAAATKFAIDAVKNAAADEAAQRTLAKTIENTTGATKDQIASVESWISKTSLAVGVTDDQLRPAFARLTRSTKDTEESQKLLNLALDISSATGKPLEAVANSLGKAYDGNTNALGKLGLGIDQSILKSKDFDAVYTNLRGTFKGFAEQEANTFEGKLGRLKIAFDEGKETVGSYIITAITPLVTLTVNKLIPALQDISDKIGKAVQPAFERIHDFVDKFVIPIFGALKDAFNTVRDAFVDNKDKLEPLLTLFKDVWDFVQKYLVPVLKTTLVGAIKGAGEAIGFVIDLISPLIEKITDGIRTSVNLAIDGINALIKAYNYANNLWGGKDVGLLDKLGASSSSGTTAAFSRSSSKISTTFSTGGTTGSGSTGTGGTSSNGAGISGAVAAAVSGALPGNISYPAMPVMSASEALFSSLTGTSGDFPGTKVSPFLAQSPNISITVNGAVDATSTARQIAGILNTEATVSGAFLELGQSRLLK